jgi:hypothetical protein
MICLSTSAEDTVSTVTIVSAAHGNGLGVDQCAVHAANFAAKHWTRGFVEHVAMTTLNFDDVEFEGILYWPATATSFSSVYQTFLSRFEEIGRQVT